MRLLTMLIGIPALVIGAPFAGAAEPVHPYAGQQARSIKALPNEDIAALRAGDGMGMAKAAELNGYPGPRHVLDLSPELHLTDAQTKLVRGIRERMSAAAKPLGAALIERERVLDELFVKGAITAERLTVETAAIANIQGRLRAVHLAAHLKTRAVLNTEQLGRIRSASWLCRAAGHQHSSGQQH
jgi:hypothetical protein